jgi:hypothetical protein
MDEPLAHRRIAQHRRLEPGADRIRHALAERLDEILLSGEHLQLLLADALTRRALLQPLRIAVVEAPLHQPAPERQKVVFRRRQRGDRRRKGLRRRKLAFHPAARIAGDHAQFARARPKSEAMRRQGGCSHAGHEGLHSRFEREFNALPSATKGALAASAPKFPASFAD